MVDLDWTTLSECENGTHATIRQLRDGRDLTKRLAALGFTEGVKVTILQNYGKGPVIVLIRETRVALGRGEAVKIWTEVTPTS